MPTVKVGDVNIYYETHGEGEPLVLIMGYGGHIGHWFRLIPLLSLEYSVVAFDNRGTGQSGKPDIPYTMEIMANDVAGLLDAVGINTAHIFGISMGGCIAQQLVLRYPERVSSLILGGTHCGIPNLVKLDKPAGNFLHDFELIQQQTPEEHEREMLNFLVSQEFIRSEKDIVDQYITKVTEYITPIHALIAQYEAIINYDNYGRLPEIKAPTLVLCGDTDKMVSPENSRLLASRIPNAELVMLEGIGHGFFLEAVEQSANVIIDFLRRHPCIE
ncbi:MAG TPA: alpha/beta hydrolase [Dehalococcoidia bacterium]|nr:alpha/beta hydrolase [Dehalococcoidia bacterium]